jgi:COP9 signalosome complex subunit 7
MQYRSSTAGTYTTLTPPQVNKLRHLTLVSLASHKRVLSYSVLLDKLDLQDGGSTSLNASASGPSSHMSARDIRNLEDIIIDAIYAGILSARLNQRQQQLEVESVLGRDVQGIQEIEKLSSVLKEW